jgi:hypothetical protein
MSGKPIIKGNWLKHASRRHDPSVETQSTENMFENKKNKTHILAATTIN